MSAPKPATPHYLDPDGTLYGRGHFRRDGNSRVWVPALIDIAENPPDGERVRALTDRDGVLVVDLTGTEDGAVAKEEAE